MPGRRNGKNAMIRMTFKGCQLPPVRDALVIGRQAPVGSEAVVRAMQAMSPGAFRLVEVDHPLIESLLIRESDLRKVPEGRLVKLLLENAGPIMDETDALNVTIEVEISVDAKIEDL